MRRPPDRGGARGFAGRIQQILAPDRSDIQPDLERWDPPAVAEARRDHLRSGRRFSLEGA